MPLRNGVVVGYQGMGGGTAFMRDLVFRALRAQFPHPGHQVVEEYRFDPGRRWRFDLAVLPERVAVEFQGGLWTGGRHVRGDGYMNDCEKALAAAAQGWVVIPVVYDHLRDRTAEVLDLIALAVEVRGREKGAV